MQVMHFDTGVLPPERRLPLFQAGAVDYDMDAIGDPLAFSAGWRMLKLGDLNAIRARVTPVVYARDRARIAADGEDRIAIHVYEAGWSEGTIDDRPLRVGPGQALVWDLARPLHMVSRLPLQVSIVTMPRHMLDEVLPIVSPAGVIAAGPELKIALRHLHDLFERAPTLPDESAAFYGRALRTLFAAAILPDRGDAPDAAAPLLQRISALLDTHPGLRPDTRIIADGLGVPEAQVADAVGHVGGLYRLVERRRLLAAYRMLSDPEELAPITAIARRCGFTDMPQFSRRFRSVFQQSATEMRRRRYGRLPRWAGAYEVEMLYAPLMKS